MPRKPRFYLPGLPVHVYQRGHNKQPVFFEEEDYLVYLRHLKAVADTFDCKIHAYVLMTNHIHLLVTPKTSDGISLLFQGIGRHFVPYINKTYERRGSLWEGRHKSSVIGADDYLLSCMRYIELNPVRANMVEHPDQYRWSSYTCNALGVDNAIIKPHELYLSLAGTANKQQAAYRALFASAVKKDESDLIYASLQSGTPIGNDKFTTYIESVTRRKIGFIKVGRPEKGNKKAGASLAVKHF